MNEVVIISKRADDYIADEGNLDINIIRSDNVVLEVDSLLKKADPGPLIAVFFIMVNEYQELFKKLRLISSGEIYYQVVLFGSEEEIQNSNITKLFHVSEFRKMPLSEVEFDFAVKKSFSFIREYYVEKAIQHDYLARLTDTKRDQEDLINIGKALSSEKDTGQLLRLILDISKKITGADAGSIYLVEEDEKGKKRLRFRFSHTFSREIPLEEFVMDINKKSIAGYVAATGEVLNIPDAYSLPEDSPYSFNKSFDRQNNYISRSMLVVPMRNHVDEIIGVIQLINSKEDLSRKLGPDENEAFTLLLRTEEDFDRYVRTFDEKYDSLLEAIAGEAAVSIENSRMIKQIQEQFEEFVKASVIAIESRDPATSGHSFRVAAICVEMAKAINNVHEGYLKDVYFTDIAIKELEFASLLHDFGKVYIDLAIFQKSKKLFPTEFENLSMRLDYLYRYIELQSQMKEIRLLESGEYISVSDECRKIAAETEQMLERVRGIKKQLSELNEPTIFVEDPESELAEIITEIENIECLTIDGECFDIITEKDLLNLSIKRGSLNPEERREIESHVIHTYNFVSKIPWPPEYKNIPEIAVQHHEFLDGSGYPAGLRGRENTLIQSRIMTVADIFDALSAQDRPYKKAVPLERVLVILREEAERGKIDSELVEVFINNKIYEKIDTSLFALKENSKV